jgi:hypothetical protein
MRLPLAGESWTASTAQLFLIFDEGFAVVNEVTLNFPIYLCTISRPLAYTLAGLFTL